LTAVWVLTLPLVAALPSPQLMLYAQGASRVPGSLNVALSVTGVPAFAVRLAGALTVGATFATVTVAAAGVLGAPFESVTVNETAYVPLSAYTWLGVALVPVVPSPKLQAYVIASQSGSDEPLPFRTTAAPSVPENGRPACAVGVRFAAAAGTGAW